MDQEDVRQTDRPRASSILKDGNQLADKREQAGEGNMCLRSTATGFL